MTKEDLNKLRVVDLRQKLTEVGLPTDGKFFVFRGCNM